MPLSWNEIRQRAITFSREWRDAERENADSQTFWAEFFQVFGRSRKAVASFEEPVKNLGGNRDRIDVFWKGRLIGESKSRGKNLDKAFSQAMGYIQSLESEGRSDEVPRYVIVTDFARIRVFDLDPQDPSDLFDMDADASVEFALEDFHEHIRRFAFIAGYDPQRVDPEDPANLDAARLLANLHDRLEDGGYSGHDLQRFMVRVLFCLFAEDTGIFELLRPSYSWKTMSKHHVANVRACAASESAKCSIPSSLDGVAYMPFVPSLDVEVNRQAASYSRSRTSRWHNSS